MKKLKLNPDRLRVDSFTTVKPEEVRGTVKGHDETSCGEWCQGGCGGEDGFFPVAISG